MNARALARTIACAGVALASTLACSGPGQGDDVTQNDSMMARAGMLSPEQVARLAARYPVLGEEPAPAPEPDGAPANGVPAALAGIPGDILETVTGEATFYADTFEGRRTASGIPFRQNQMVAAHRAYPFGTILRVTNTRNDRSVNVRVVDRGPHGAIAKARNTIIDLSRRAADELGYVAAGRTPVKVEVLQWGPGLRRVG